MPDHIEMPCFLQFKAVCWRGAKALPEGVVESLTGRPNTPFFSFRAVKSLVAPTRLDQLKNIVGLARRRIKRYCLPFPVPAVHLLSKAAIDSLQPYLEEMKAGFDRLVAEFEENYPEAIMEAEANLGEHFQLWDYPVEIKTRFSFDWRFMRLPWSAGFVSPEVQDEEIQKYTDLMAEARTLAVAGLRKQFAVIVSHLVKELSPDGKGRIKAIKKDVFDRLLDFFDEFRQKNIFQDEELSQLVAEAQMAMSGLDEADDLSQSWLGRHLQEQFSALQERIDEAIIDRPRRLIRPRDLPDSPASDETMEG